MWQVSRNWDKIYCQRIFKVNFETYWKSILKYIASRFWNELWVLERLKFSYYGIDYVCQSVCPGPSFLLKFNVAGAWWFVLPLVCVYEICLPACLWLEFLSAGRLHNLVSEETIYRSCILCVPTFRGDWWSATDAKVCCSIELIYKGDGRADGSVSYTIFSSYHFVLLFHVVFLLLLSLLSCPRISLNIFCCKNVWRWTQNTTALGWAWQF